LEQSAAYTKTQGSVHIALSTTGEVPGFRIKTLDGDLTNKPAVAAKGKAGAIFGSPSDPPTNIEFTVVDGNIYAAIGGKWTALGSVDKVYPVGNILDPKVGLANILANIKNPVAEGREQIGGVNAVRIAGTVDASVLKGIYPDVEHELPVKAWVREDGSHELLQSLIQVTPSAGIQITDSNWGEPVTVTKPGI
jgi:lipoprotein LprG